MTSEQAAPAAEMSFGVVPAAQRTEIYLDYLNDSKERQLVREVLARNLLVSLAQMNQHHIKEYPLLPVQQDALIEFITLRSSSDNRVEAYIQGLIDSFISALEKYVTANESGDQQDKETARAAILNSESLLVKCLQGICFSIAICGDNFIEALQHIFGEGALAVSDEIIHQYPMGEVYWEEHLRKIVEQGVRKAFDNVRESKAVEIRKEKQLLSLTYSFDSIFERLNPAPYPVEKSQFQREFEKGLEANIQDNAVSMAKLLSKSEVFKMDLKPSFLETLGQIMRLEAAAVKFKEDAHADILSKEQSFRELQLLSVACGAFITLQALEADFLHAVSSVFPQAAEKTRDVFTSFSPVVLEKILYHFVEVMFIQILCECFGESRSQIRLKVLHLRSIDEEKVKALLPLPGIQTVGEQLWRADPLARGKMIFHHATPQELKAFLQQNVSDGRALAAIVKLWQAAEIKTRFNILIYIDKLAKATTNLNHRLSLILGRFGIVSL